MTRVTWPWRALVLVTAVAIATVSTGAQQDSSGGAPSMAAQRSYQLQAQLRAIEANRAGFVNQLLSEWSRYAEGSAYDVWSEFYDIAMRVPVWQLYGASLVGDYQTMGQVLTGARGAGQYINSLDAPQPKTPIGPTWSRLDAGVTSFAPPTAAVLGDTTNSLVFTPIRPCRMVDTRGTGARTGPIAANTSRNFDLEDDGFASGQGGATSLAQCPGLPTFSHYGWAVNITVVGYGLTPPYGAGLKAWPFASTEPNASVINFVTGGAPAVANGLTLTGCWGCGDDITVKAFDASTHVVIDVVGYYHQAAVSASAVTRVAGTPVNISASSGNIAVGGLCPAGTTVIGGENDWASSFNVAIAETHQGSGFNVGSENQWGFYLRNNDASTRSVTAYSKCQDTPVEIF